MILLNLESCLLCLNGVLEKRTLHMCEMSILTEFTEFRLVLIFRNFHIEQQKYGSAECHLNDYIITILLLLEKKNRNVQTK